MATIIKTASDQQTKEYACEYAQTLRAGAFVALYGDLGAGKTTFAQGILMFFDAPEPYTSPTFAIVNAYTIKHENIHTIYHIDAYRIAPKDLDDIGWKTVIADLHGLVILEWSERIADAIPKHAKKIHFETIDASTRKIWSEDL